MIPAQPPAASPLPSSGAVPGPGGRPSGVTLSEAQEEESGRPGEGGGSHVCLRRADVTQG